MGYECILNVLQIYSKMLDSEHSAKFTFFLSFFFPLDSQPTVNCRSSLLIEDACSCYHRARASSTWTADFGVHRKLGVSTFRSVASNAERSRFDPVPSRADTAVNNRQDRLRKNGTGLKEYKKVKEKRMYQKTSPLKVAPYLAPTSIFISLDRARRL